MIEYFDSSLVLSMLLKEERQHEAHSIWNASNLRVSSVLLKVEPHISLERIYKHTPNRFSGHWLSDKQAELDALLAKVVFIPLTESLADFMRQTKGLAGCKSLDAIHIATALHISKRYGVDGVRVHTFDKMMVRTAQELGFAV
jgi:predicted nucleic acid-binding protein